MCKFVTISLAYIWLYNLLNFYRNIIGILAMVELTLLVAKRHIKSCAFPEVTVKHVNIWYKEPVKLFPLKTKLNDLLETHCYNTKSQARAYWSGYLSQNNRSTHILSNSSERRDNLRNLMNLCLTNIPTTAWFFRIMTKKICRINMLGVHKAVWLQGVIKNVAFHNVSWC